MTPPTVFISYSWERQEHKDWVRMLGERLVDAGVLVCLDQWDSHPGIDLPNFMDSAIRESDHVILVCTPGFREKADANKGGVGYEKSIVTGEIFSGSNKPKKFVPILRNGTPDKALPSYLRSRVFIDFRRDANFEPALDSLIRHVHQAPKYVRPALGQKPDLSPVPPATTLHASSRQIVRPLKSVGLDDAWESRDAANLTIMRDIGRAKSIVVHDSLWWLRDPWLRGIETALKRKDSHVTLILLNPECEAAKTRVRKLGLREPGWLDRLDEAICSNSNLNCYTTDHLFSGPFALLDRSKLYIGFFAPTVESRCMPMLSFDCAKPAGSVLLDSIDHWVDFVRKMNLSVRTP